MKKLVMGVLFFISLAYASDMWYSQAYLGYLSLGYLSMLYTNGLIAAEEVMSRVREIRVIAQASLKGLYNVNDAKVQSLRIAYENLFFQANGLLSLVQTPSAETLQVYEQLRQKTWYSLEMVKEFP